MIMGKLTTLFTLYFSYLFKGFRWTMIHQFYSELGTIRLIPRRENGVDEGKIEKIRMTKGTG